MSLRWGNESLFDTIEKELPRSTFSWLMISICLAISWVVYITYYNSRVLGLILTTILNHFIKHGHIKFGSFSISVLSGKIMFRDMQWITEDYSVRVQLGLAIFRWWRPLTLKEITEDLSHSETRLSVYLDSFEWHIYNRSTVYAELESLFGLEPHIKQQHQKQQQPETNTETSVSGPGGVESKWQWRDLIPVIKFDISSGRIVFGNYHMSTTLSANFGDTHMVYTTKPASTPFDQFMHVLTCKTENLRVMFVPSPDSKAPEDEPPRFMGDGFVVLHSNNADIYYYYDEPGLVPYEPEMVELANGDVVARRTWPCWGMDVKCGKGTDISYGPWADRQREKLHRFFFPQNYQPLEATILPSPGEIRMYKCFDFKMSVQAECTIDILFTKDKETQAIHMNTQAGSYLDATVPYVLENDGYTTKVNGQLMNVDATSSLQFRSFLECETLQFDIETVYPKYWNDHQKWRLDLTACKSSLYLIFDHKYFFADLVNDWSSKARDDLYRFVPYTWQVCFLLKQFEIITLVNEYNWIDCFGKTPENAHIAVRGDTLDVSFVLPFIDFLPPTVSLPITFKGEFAVLSLYLPEKNTSRHALLSIARTMKIVGRDGKELSQPFGSAESQGKWMRTTDKSIGWVDCMEAPSVAVNLNYMYHPMALLEAEDGDSNQGEPTSTLSSEEKVLNMPHLIPLRPLRPRKKQPSGMSIDEFDASQMEADVIFVDVEIAPSVLCAYGSLIGNILHLKENYLGEDSKFTDYEASATTKENSVFEHINSVTTKLETFDPRVYRPLEVKVEVTLHDIQAHLVKNCKRDDPPCPWIFIERLSVEVNKNYEETKVQVLVAPAFLLASDKIKRPLPHAHLQDGHMRLSGLQIRGHAMFSHEGLPIDSETLEYAWLVEITVGELTGRVTAPQLQMIVECLEELVFLVEDAENSLQRPDVSQQLCHHRVSQMACTQSLGFPCPSSNDLRYTMTRVTIDGISLYLVEAGSALSLQLYPIRLSTCNLHGKNNKAGITALIPHIKVKQFVLSLPTLNQYNSNTDLWLESGSVSLGPITVNSAMALEYPELRHIQDTFLKRYDRRSCRLNFLWPPEDGATLAGKCGCVGGCSFFGNNRNGTTVFQPSDYDSRHGLNSVMYHRVDDEAETTLGFGQSILHAGRFIFYTPDIPSSENTLKACHRNGDLADGDTARSSVTLVEQESAKSLLCLSESPGGSTDSMSEDNFTTETGTNAGKELAEESHRHSSHVVDGRIYRDKLKSTMLPADRPLSDGLQGIMGHRERLRHRFFCP
ncbi:hypothetical protein LSAT2_002397 [Lamellibrachia satsuma]|nr:hypothetical protein LSAT2_002397 [Lamellibrachia satsuma]